MTTILNLLGLSPEQAAAALSDRPAVAVTAGAGSGKTRTLAGRYLWYIEQGYPVRSLVAVTFTEKAAREMRNRIRDFISRWRNQAEGGDQKALWDQANIDLDAARIGTIHSLCATILRAHPAEAAVDPMFEVLEENTAILLQSRAVEQTLAWAIDDSLCAQLFGPLNEFRLRSTMSDLLAKRLDADPAFQALAKGAEQCWSDAAAAWFAEQLGDEDWRQALVDLATISARKPADKMDTARRDVLEHWQTVQENQTLKKWDQLLAELVAMRKANSHLGAKGNWTGDDLAIARDAMKTLRDHHDKTLKPLLGKTAPSWTLDEQAAALQPGLHRLFLKCLTLYDDMKNERHALDFDDLESRTTTLLNEHPEVRYHWQANITAILVDEFQDTNARQRKIIYHLAGFERSKGAAHSASERESIPQQTTLDIGSESASHPGSLFIVGDGKQSIYRFRGADVTVFRQAQIDIVAAQGQALSLGTTFRAHRSLGQTLNQLLAPIMGEEDDPRRPYQTPFTPLRAYRLEPDPHIQPPYLEFHLGLGSAAEGRVSSAAGLAQRLQQLHEEGCKWKHMALLFRASTAFGVYEHALEAASIPFVTVAGRGFYDRPEIRDLLNTMAAISDPSDDLVMAGLLRSPMFGLTDAALFLLRWGPEPDRSKLGFWQAVNDDSVLATLDEMDAQQARRARIIISELHDMAGRQRVAFVLKQLLDLTFYRAALRLATDGERAWRNVDKLLADAHRSRLVSVPDFLEYVRNLRDVAAREGEAVAEADDAVQLMTIHKAKGLEFPIVVLADASYSGRFRAPALLLDDSLGPLMRISDGVESGAKPLAYQLGVLRQRDMDAAEEKRLLYVAATRAEEKLLISGYSAIGKSGRLQSRGWIKTLGEVVGLDDIRLDETPILPTHETLTWHNGGADLSLYPTLDTVQTSIAPPTGFRPLTSDRRSLDSDLIAPLPAIISPDRTGDKIGDKEVDPPVRVWRLTSTGNTAPNWVIGTLVHKALQHWHFPDQPGFDAFIRSFALEIGLISAREVRSAVRETARLVSRFQDQAIFAYLDRAERYHEVPYSVDLDGQTDSGVIDLLARSAPDDAYQIYDFKTDQLKTGTDLLEYVEARGYSDQIRRYIAAVEQITRQRPQATIIFLNVGGEVRTEVI